MDIGTVVGACALGCFIADGRRPGYTEEGENAGASIGNVNFTRFFCTLIGGGTSQPRDGKIVVRRSIAGALTGLGEPVGTGAQGKTAAAGKTATGRETVTGQETATGRETGAGSKPRRRRLLAKLALALARTSSTGGEITTTGGEAAMGGETGVGSRPSRRRRLLARIALELAITSSTGGLGALAVLAWARARTRWPNGGSWAALGTLDEGERRAGRLSLDADLTASAIQMSGLDGRGREEEACFLALEPTISGRGLMVRKACDRAWLPAISGRGVRELALDLTGKASKRRRAADRARTSLAEEEGIATGEERLM